MGFTGAKSTHGRAGDPPRYDEPMATAAVLLAGGSGTRLERSDNKAYVAVGGRPLLGWSLETLSASPLVDAIVVVTRPADRPRLEALLAVAGTPVRGLVDGGPTRQASEAAGLAVLGDDIAAGAVDLVLVHDAARPFVSHALVARVVTRARAVGGALPGLPLEGPVVRETPGGLARAVAGGDLRRVQTPQAFAAGPLIAAHRAATAAGLAGDDTAAVVERFADVPTDVVRGDPCNVKVTYARDLALAERIATRWSPGQP